MTSFPLDDQGKIRIDLATLLGTRALVQANSGGGKSWLLRLIAEGTSGKAPIIIIDPEGEFATLREKYDFALVGREGELPMTLDSAAMLARKLVEFRVSAIVNLSDLDSLDAKREYVRLFLESLIAVPRKLWGPMLVMIDEAHRFAPKQGGEAESSSAVVTLMDAGRKRGFCGIVATQRLAKLHNDVIAEANNVFIGRTWLDNDQERAGDTLGLKKQDRQVLRELKPGEWFAFGPALSIPGVSRFHSASVSTTHPKPGQRHQVDVPKASAHIHKIIEQLGDVPAQATEEISILESSKRRVVELERKVADLNRQLATRPVQQQLIPKVERVEVTVFKDGEVKRLEAAVAGLAEVGAQFVQFGNQLTAASGEVNTALRTAAARVNAPVKTPQPRAMTPAPAPRLVATPKANNDSTITAPQQRILDALAWLDSIGVGQADKTQLALLADQSPTSSGYTNNLGTMRTAGLISYPAPGQCALTEAGRAQASYPETAPTTESLQQSILSRLPKPKAAILRELIAVYPDSLTKAELAERAGQSATSSGYTNNLGSLRSLGLIEYPQTGYAVALPILFLKEAAR